MKIRKNLLIICEGTSTEPNYFHDLRNRIIQFYSGYSIEIRPKPPQESKDEQDLAQEVQPRNGGRRRALLGVAVDESDMVEDKYKAQPTRYVREAQLGLVEGTFEEVWAVYDLDGHADHENSYLLAQEMINGRKVHIGFSSVSFESWVLWHFERHTRPFLKSQCRIGKSLHDCGQGTHAEDCKGVHCIVGYSKEQGYISKEKDVKAIRFTELAPNVHTALTNAQQIRLATIAANPGLSMYTFNPYTTVDRLVFKMLNIPMDYQWIESNEISIPGFRAEIQFEGNMIHIQVISTIQSRQIIQPDFVRLVNVKNEVISVLSRRLVEPLATEHFSVDLAAHMDFVASYIAFRIDENTYQIMDLPRYG